jgi:7-cyano-7-deazaguanine synthase
MAARQQATVLFSGGIDSTACAHFLQAQTLLVHGLFVDYCQASADLEARAVSTLSKKLGMETHTVTLRGLESSTQGELPGRNGLLLSIALFATRGKSGVIGIGVHSGTSYYDCSNSFIDAANKIISDQTDQRVTIIAPFIDWSKRDVYDYFIESQLPLADTYSCENGIARGCGICASCRDREALGC